MKRRALLAGALGATALGGCATPDDGPVEGRPLNVRDLAKTDIGVVAETHYRFAIEQLRRLTAKLYRRNPRQWRSSGKPSAEFALERIFRPRQVPDFVELHGRRAGPAIRAALEADYAGDRVLAFAAGLTAMVQAAYGNRTEFYLFDPLDPQKLYNSARNIEIAAWLLGTAVDARGTPLLRSNSLPGEPRNLSFERIFGKLIGGQDTLAQIVAGGTDRGIRKVIQRLAGAVFLPI